MILVNTKERLIGQLQKEHKAAIGVAKSEPTQKRKHGWEMRAQAIADCLDLVENHFKQREYPYPQG